ncbi:hypothetical protein BD310DRAFT_303607 [Dichomitus squalens]|uniref:Uncharacterized protein n=1 Tax=Dichomitus squalens TaxID=114155 RepID=A0A4Q9QEC9_9APHY|nr:hypothetical protein BD310DRAFT_303607 [Dichomitus squalens]
MAAPTDKKDLYGSTELLAVEPQVAPGGPSPPSPQYENPSLPNDPEVLPQYTERAFEGAYVPTGGEEQPPHFTPYEAEFFLSGGEIVSHDPHLNQDGEALYRFLLAKAAAFPDYKIHARGTHTEHKTRTVYSKDQNGNYSTKIENYSETVTDFDFYIDLTPQIVHGPVHWSLPDAEPAYRGEMYMQVDSNDLAIHDPEVALPPGRRKATKAEMKAAKERKELRKEYGLPPWVAPDPESWFQQSGAPPRPAVVLQSSKTLREWADEYCTSDKLLKEFTYTKVVYGWNISNLEEAITAAIRSVYSHTVQLSFDISNHKIRIRPDNRLSRTLSNKWLKFLLWILLIYPFIWLYKRFSAHGGGRWEVCGGAYALKTWHMRPQGTSGPPPNVNRLWQQTPNGWAYLVGDREGEWFQRWEGRIRAAVRDRIQSRTPLELVAHAATRLDGYRPQYVGPPPPEY